MRQIGIHRPGLRCIILPLGVRQEFRREAEFGFATSSLFDLRFVRTDAEIDDESVVYMTNYESVREGKIDPRRFRAVSLDEASVLAQLRKQNVSRIFAPVRNDRVQVRQHCDAKP